MSRATPATPIAAYTSISEPDTAPATSSTSATTTTDTIALNLITYGPR